MPEFKKRPVDQEAPSGSSVTFSAEFEGNPTPQAKWLKNGIEISPSARYVITSTEFSSSLTIKELWDTDNNSQITCLLVNPLGKESSDANLKIKACTKSRERARRSSCQFGRHSQS